ncbi:MAG: hypothetical protein QME40_05465 [bacterium]|nr:hypothetical protein [bacterium]
MEFRSLATAIGSLPHQGIERVCELILGCFPEIPFWPQLPKRRINENMYRQYVQNLPCVKITPDKDKVYFDTSLGVEEELERFYDRYLASDIEYFAIRKEDSEGFYAMLDYLRENRPATLQFIKGQVTGPISLGLTCTDQHERAILYNQGLRDAIIKGLAMKAIWQVECFKKLGLDTKEIIFFDEPYLSALGSAYINIKREDVVRWLNDVIEPVKEKGCIVGIHCCGNTDWSVLMATSVDIISFDAYNFLETMVLYPAELNRFLKKGGSLAFGIVPTSGENALNENVEDLVKRLFRGIKPLKNKGIDEGLILSRSLITPSCGLGSLSKDVAERILRLTHDVSLFLRAEGGF